MAEAAHPIPQGSAKSEHGFVRAIGLFDGTMIVVGSMIGSGIFIVAADISRQTGSPGGLLLTWILTGLLTISAALSYGELAALFPHAGGQYVYLREAYSPLWGFLYGWTLFLVIQTGTIAAVAVGFARYLGVLLPSISPTAWIIHPLALSSKYAISLSVQQLVGVLMIVFLTFINTLGVRLGKLIQNIFTSAKTLSLVGLILLGVFVGRNAAAISENFSHLWAVRGAQPIEPGANLAYLCTLPLAQIQNAPDDRVASAALNAVFGPAGAMIMAGAIIISTFGCNNGLILAGARVSYAMAKDGLFFRSTGTLNKKGVPGSALAYQGIWVIVLILLRTRHVDAAGMVTYGNLYSDLLDYVVFSVLIFYVLPIAGIFILRRKRPGAERPYKAFGYPFVPLLYIVAAAAIMFVLLLYKTQTTWPGLVIVLLGVPVYVLWARSAKVTRSAS